MRRALLAASALCAALACGGREAPLETLFPVPAFALVDQDGNAFGSEQLRGRVWIASFLFTSCTTVCPTFTSQLANLSRRLAPHGDRVRLVSITVDPDVDTPARLREYAARYGADHAAWTFLTGEPQVVRETLRRSFFQPDPERTDTATGYDRLHGTGVLLVDREGTCRGIYRSDAPGLDQLAHDVERLLD